MDDEKKPHEIGFDSGQSSDPEKQQQIEKIRKLQKHVAKLRERTEIRLQQIAERATKKNKFKREDVQWLYSRIRWLTSKVISHPFIEHDTWHEMNDRIKELEDENKRLHTWIADNKDWGTNNPETYIRMRLNVEWAEERMKAMDKERDEQARIGIAAMLDKLWGEGKESIDKLKNEDFRKEILEKMSKTMGKEKAEQYLKELENGLKGVGLW